MNEQKNKNTTRNIVTAAAIFGAALIAFSFNQGGLTGRATGGAAGCGGDLPVASDDESGQADVSESAANLDVRLPVVRLNPQGGTQVLIESRPTIGEPGDMEIQEGNNPLLNNPIADARPGTILDRLELDGFTRFIDLIKAAEMIEVFNNESAEFTVFAPTNDAVDAWPRVGDFENPANRALLQATIRQHMVPGRSELVDLGDNPDTEIALQPLMIDFGSNVVMTSHDKHKALITRPNRESDRGMVNGIDNVLEPVMTAQIMTLQAGYNLFYAMMQATGVVEEVADPTRPMTVLALSDETMIEAGLELEVVTSKQMQPKLQALLQNHIIEGAYNNFDDASAETLSGHRISSDGGDKIAVSTGETLQLVGHASAANGVIHEVDAALLGDLVITR